MNEISAWLKKKMQDEHLWNAQAARFLNLNPLYVSMMLNAKSFHACTVGAWARAEQVKDAGICISDFKIPEGEEIFSRPEPKKDKIILPAAEKAESVLRKEKADKELAASIQAKKPATEKPVNARVKGIEKPDRLAKIEEAIKERNRFFLQQIEDMQREIAQIKKAVLTDVSSDEKKITIQHTVNIVKR
jgi:hypothetical protein